MEDNYISNFSSNIDGDESDMKLLKRNKELEAENEKLKNDLVEANKKNLIQKHQIEGQELEHENFIETIKNLQGLIEYYKENRKDDDEEEENAEKMRDMELKLVKCKDKIKDLEDAVEVKNSKIEQMNLDMKELSSLNEKLISVITSKDEEIRNLTDKKKNLPENDDAPLSENVDDLKKYIKDLKEKTDAIRADYETKINELTSENDEVKLKLRDAENEINELKEDNEKLGKKTVDEDIDINAMPQEVEGLKEALNEMKQSKQKLKERAEKQRDLDLQEIQELSRINRELKYTIKDLQEDLNRNEYNLENNAIIIENYKSKLNQKNMEIENLISKCNEFKENLDQDEKDRDEFLQKYDTLKENSETQIKELSKKLEITLKELNEQRVASGKEEINVDQMMNDPKQKLADEIENKDKNIEELKKNIENLKKDKTEAEAQNKFLQSSIDTLNKNINLLKEQKSKAGEDFDKEMEKLQIQIGDYKCQLAMKEYETDQEIIKYKAYVKKLQAKLEKMGFKFRRKTMLPGQLGRTMTAV